MCVLWLGCRLRPATPGWGVGVYVCLCACSACTSPLPARACGVWVGCRLAPVPVQSFVAACARCPGLRHPVAVFAWHLSLCLDCGRRHASLACTVAPRWCAALRLLRSLLVLRSAFPRLWCLSPPQGACTPRSTRLLRRAHGGQPRTGHFVSAHGCCRRSCGGLAPRCTRPGPRDRVVPGGSLGRRSWSACAAVVCVCGPGQRRIRFPVPSVFRQGTRPVQRGCFVWTPTPPLSGQRRPRPGPVCVCRCVLSGPGRSRRHPRRVFVRFTLSCSCSWCSLCLLGPLWAGVALPVVVLSFYFFLVRLPCPWLSVISCPGCLGPLRPVVPPLCRFFFLFSFSPPLCVLSFFSPVVFFYNSSSFLSFFFLLCRRVLGVGCWVGVSWA